MHNFPATSYTVHEPLYNIYLNSNISDHGSFINKTIFYNVQKFIILLYINKFDN